ncbi:MAG: FAD-binding oxidoreductase [Candidatus Harrisonbacteria bacterium CG10_big_fil_rev_8_21_14_0_10_40_38]|uniref:FAD-binding oxidoreductase n=1 Tax=Candidatus Harrisonbacteria bacterium CG10_big_fil_rev_8_21_14_0_10_40_38 TaxID=1974583 RepID=A0A2H0URV8_9BACT|nr:MAG: FAD-binding oxidoreductase [Candidatus Harrisonbacteria bacterium CG10_big_fil_rev_8_21_14_0_10_40_38]
MRKHLEPIQKFFHGDLTEDAETLKTHSHDASLFEIKPELVAYPKDVEDISSLVNYATEEKKNGDNVSIVPRAGGTDMTGGPLTESISLDFTKYFNKIKEVGEGYAVTEPGVYYRDFEKETLAKGYLFPSYPASREICAMGGIVANNSGGEKTLTYGKTEDYVESVKMVCADGKEYEFRALNKKELGAKKRLKSFEGSIYRSMSKLIDDNYELIQSAKPNVSKNSAGYFLWNVMDHHKGTFDLTKVIVGSQGTLGIITEAKLRLIKPKQHARLLVSFLYSLDSLGDIISAVLKHKPESFESYDDHTFKLAVKFFPQFSKRLGGNLFKLGFSFLPEIFMVVTGGIPKLVLLAEFTGDNEEEVSRRAKEAQKELEAMKITTKLTKKDSESKKYWAIRRESFNLLRQRLKNLRTAPFIDDFVVRPEKLAQFLPRLNEILSRYDIIYTVAGHVGDGNFHIIPLVDPTDPKLSDTIKNLSHEVYSLVFSFEGSMTGEHNDGLIRGPYLSMMYGPEIYKLFTETKKIFDPSLIFNPGKKVDASLDYAHEHLLKH